MPKKKPHPLEQLRYYVTVLVSVVAILSFFALLFLVPFVYDPAISTLSAGFPQRPDTCLLSQIHVGARLSECHWASCSEGCTAPKTQCVQLLVNVSHVPYHMFQPTPHAYTDQIWVGRNVPLRINVQGCGYPPLVNCTTFLRRIGRFAPAPPPGRADVKTFPLWAMHNGSALLPLRAFPLAAYDVKLTAGRPSAAGESAHDMRSRTLSVSALPHPDLPTAFPCYQARARPDQVIMDYEERQVLLVLVLSAAVPTLTLLLAVGTLCYCHAGWCRRSCPQLPIPDDKLNMIPPELTVSQATDVMDDQ